MGFEFWKEIMTKGRLFYLKTSCESLYKKMKENKCLSMHLDYIHFLAYEAYGAELRRNYLHLHGTDVAYTAVQLAEGFVYRNIIWNDSPCRFLQN